MNANANIIDPVRGTSDLVRPRFSPGLLLRDDDLNAGVDYTRDLSRLLFRSLFGCGVICGLDVTVELLCGKLRVTVAPGVALDGMGNPIHVPAPKTVTVDPTCGQSLPPLVWVTLCRTEKCCAPRSTVCGCDEEEDSAAVCTREQDGFEIRLRKDKPDDCACLCPEQRLPDTSAAAKEREGEGDCACADPCGCHKDHYAGKCSCSCCDPDCVVLAVLADPTRDERTSPKDREQAERDGASWSVNHSVRRFIRPVLMRDPIVFREQFGRDPCDPAPVPAKQPDPAEKAEPAQQIAQASAQKASPVRQSRALGQAAEQSKAGGVLAAAYRDATAKVERKQPGDPAVAAASTVQPAASRKQTPGRTRQK